MRNSSTALSQRQIKVPFHGAELYVVEHEGQPFVPMKPIVEGMGLAWQPQHRKLTESRFESTITELVMVAQDGKQRKVVCMALRKLPGWLMSIEPGKVKDPTVRGRVVQFQGECDDALWQYWNDGIALNPRMAFSVNPGDILTIDQQETLRLMIKTLVESLPQARQGGAAKKVWSKLHSHFKVSYRQIPQSEFTEAVSIVTRTAAEWEVVDPEPEPAAVRHTRYTLDDCLHMMHGWYLGNIVPSRVEVELARLVLMATKSAVKEATLQLAAVKVRNRDQSNLLAARRLLSRENISTEIPPYYATFCPNRG